MHACTQHLLRYAYNFVLVLVCECKHGHNIVHEWTSKDILGCQSLSSILFVSPVIFYSMVWLFGGFIAVYSKLGSPQASWESPALLLVGVLGLQKGILPLHRFWEFKLKSLLLCNVYFMDCVISPAIAFFLNAMNVHSAYKYDFVLSRILITKYLGPAVTTAVLYILWPT